MSARVYRDAEGDWCTSFPLPNIAPGVVDSAEIVVRLAPCGASREEAEAQLTRYLHEHPQSLSKPGGERR